jgi:hypothetical protein
LAKKSGRAGHQSFHHRQHCVGFFILSMRFVFETKIEGVRHGTAAFEKRLLV